MGQKLVIDCSQDTAQLVALTSADQTVIDADAQADAVVQQQAAATAQADGDDRTAMLGYLQAIQTDISNLTADSTALTGTGTLSTAQLRAMLARTDDAVVRLERGLLALCRRMARRGY